MSVERQDMEREGRQTRVLVYLYSGELKQAFGSYKLEVSIDSEEPLSVEELFKQVRSIDGTALADMLIESGRISPRYAVFIAGKNIETIKGAKTLVTSGESIAILEVVARITGG